MSYNTESNFTRKKLENYSYQLNNNIGKGYSSQVFKGRNDITNETVAIKVIDMKMIKGQVHKNLLASEIEVLKALKNSENIIEVYDIYTTKNNTYIITQLCDGGDLAKVLTTRKTLPEHEAIDLMTQIINGYNCITNRGVIHRDLKPANIFLKQKEVKIADFGFAMKNSDSKKYSSYNVGSPIYMPPEALNDNKYSFKSDVWALGVIFFEMLTGKTPWRAKTEKQLGKQLLSIPISKLLPKGLSQASNQFLLKTLAVSVTERMTTDELSRFTFHCDKEKTDAKSTRADLVSSNSISEAKNILLKSSNRDTSLNRNTVNTPKNIKRFNFLKGNNNTQQLKGGSLPKTSTTVSMKTEYLISPSNQNFNPAHMTGTQKELSGFRSTNNIATIIDKKMISKELLSQVHFCRFIYKLLIRIEKKLSQGINGDFTKMKEEMAGLTFNKLQEIENLRLLTGIEAKEYRATSDFTKIIQIVHQYQTKYTKDLADLSRNFISYESLKNELTQQIVSLHRTVNASVSSAVKEEVIVLDYLITLRQLLYIMEQDNMHVFHNKSKMEKIVEGAPSDEITSEHISAITNKLRTLKML